MANQTASWKSSPVTVAGIVTSFSQWNKGDNCFTLPFTKPKLNEVVPIDSITDECLMLDFLKGKVSGSEI